MLPEGLSAALGSLDIIEKAQVFVWHGRRYCWYDDGWQGPGFYRCGYARRHGLGWGGGEGWHGWRQGVQPSDRQQQGRQPKGVQQQGVQPKSVAPQGVAPQGGQPKSVAPQGVAPQGGQPKSVAPQGVAPQGGQPKSVAPQGVAPQGGQPKSVRSHRVASRRATSRRVARINRRTIRIETAPRFFLRDLEALNSKMGGQDGLEPH